MIYHCPTCGIYWYILNEYHNHIAWKRLSELLVAKPEQTLQRYCPHHIPTSAEVKA